VRRSSWQEDPVSLLQEEPLAVHLKFGGALKQYDPLIMVLVVVNRLVDHTADDLLYGDITHVNNVLDVLTVHGSIGAR
jgi:hypothetical protein